MGFPAWAPASLLQQVSSDPIVLAARVHHATFAEIRLVRNSADLVSRTLTYTASWFDVTLINDDGQPPRCRFQMPNVMPDIGRMISRVIEPVELTLDVISLAHPDEPMMSVPRLQLRNLVIDPVMISGDLVGRDFSAEPLGTKRVTPAKFPALYRRRS